MENITGTEKQIKYALDSLAAAKKVFEERLNTRALNAVKVIELIVEGKLEEANELTGGDTDETWFKCLSYRWFTHDERKVQAPAIINEYKWALYA